MKYPLTVVLLLHGFLSFTQTNCDLIPDIHSSNGTHIALSTLTEEEYLRLKAPTYHPWRSINSDSAETVILAKFPHIFKKVNACYRFKTFENKDIKFCKKVADGSDDRIYQHYQIVDWSSKYITFYMTEYENWEYYVVDTETGYAYSLSDRPNYSVNYMIAYGLSDYYGEEGISILNFSNQTDTHLSFKNWNVDESYIFGDQFIRFKMKNQDCSQTKYLEILMQ